MNRPFLAFGGLLLLFAGMIVLISRIKPSQPDVAKAKAPRMNAAERFIAFEKISSGGIKVKVDTELAGSFVMEVYPKAAPETTSHFLDLVKQGFYDGLRFHRVVPGFVAQGGDPGSRNTKIEDYKGLSNEEAGSKFHLGTGGSGTTVPLEAGLPHLPYTVGLARSSDLNSGDSQFYINLADNESLDGDYCIFGRRRRRQGEGRQADFGRGDHENDGRQLKGRNAVKSKSHSRSVLDQLCDSEGRSRRQAPDQGRLQGAFDWRCSGNTRFEVAERQKRQKRDDARRDQGVDCIRSEEIGGKRSQSADDVGAGNGQGGAQRSLRVRLFENEFEPQS